MNSDNKQHSNTSFSTPMMHFALALALLHTASAWSPLLFLRGDPIPQELRLDWEGMTSKKEAFERRR